MKLDRGTVCMIVASALLFVAVIRAALKDADEADRREEARRIANGE